MSRSLIFGLCGLAMLGMAAAGGVRMALGGDSFDPAAWQSHRHSDARDNPRAGMLGDLEAGYLQPGMGRTRIVELLGPPDRQEDSRYVYNLGASAFGADYEAYVVEFDGSDRVTRYYVKRY